MHSISRSGSIARATLLAFAIITAFPVPASARPLTQPTAENERGMREHFDALAVRTAGMLAFPDLDVRDPAFPAVSWLKKEGVVSGFEDGSIRTWAPVTRAEILKIILRAKDPLAQDEPTAALTFPDVDRTLWYAPYVAYGVREGFIRGFDDGTFRPNALVSVNEARKMSGLSWLDDGNRVAARGEAFRILIDSLTPERLLPPTDFSDGMRLTISGRDVLGNGVPVRGLFANWLVRPTHGRTALSRERIRAELARMRASGFVGISTEVAWEDIEPTDGAFETPAYMDDLLEEAEKAGFWVNILLASHYTPEWVLSKYGDIGLYDVTGTHVPEGEYMMFSISSPAVEDQLAWQKKAANHYAQHPNVLAFFLSNEQSYGNKFDLDYSVWAEGAWQEWRRAHGLAPAEMPRASGHPETLRWRRFRQDNLVSYLNRLQRGVSEGLDRFIPVSHKVIFYEATSAYAPQYGILPSPARLRMDVVGADIYGLTPNVYPAQLAFQKPILVVETNLPGPWSADAMYDYLVYQSFQGIATQSIFQWNPGEHENVLFHFDGTPWDKALRLRDAGLALASQSHTYPTTLEPNVGIVIPMNAVQLSGDDYQTYQYTFDRLASLYERDANAVLTLLWADDLGSNGANERSISPSQLLSPLKALYILLPSEEKDLGESEALRSWVAEGGTLYMPRANLDNLTWIAKVSAPWQAYGKGRVYLCATTCTKEG